MLLLYARKRELEVGEWDGMVSGIPTLLPSSARVWIYMKQTLQAGCCVALST